MTDGGPVDPERVPSLSVVEQALTVEESFYRFRANGLDSKAGLTLGAAGVLVALIGLHPGVLGLVSQILALASGAAAVRVLFPRVDKTVGVGELRDRYLGGDPVRTRLIVLNTRIDLHDRDERQLLAKLRYFRAAAGLLLMSSAALVIRAIVELF